MKSDRYIKCVKKYKLKRKCFSMDMLDVAAILFERPRRNVDDKRKINSITHEISQPGEHFVWGK
jgi:hypothetical protein